MDLFADVCPVYTLADALEEGKATGMEHLEKPDRYHCKKAIKYLETTYDDWDRYCLTVPIVGKRHSDVPVDEWEPVREEVLDGRALRQAVRKEFNGSVVAWLSKASNCPEYFARMFFVTF